MKKSSKKVVKIEKARREKNVDQAVRAMEQGLPIAPLSQLLAKDLWAKEAEERNKKNNRN